MKSLITIGANRMVEAVDIRLDLEYLIENINTGGMELPDVIVWIQDTINMAKELENDVRL